MDMSENDLRALYRLQLSRAAKLRELKAKVEYNPDERIYINTLHDLYDSVIAGTELVRRVLKVVDQGDERDLIFNVDYDPISLDVSSIAVRASFTEDMVKRAGFSDGGGVFEHGTF